MFETHRSDINVFFFKNDEGMLAVEVFVSPKLQRAINKRVRRYEAALAYLGGDVFIRITSMKALLTGLIQDVEGRRDDLKIHRRLNQRYVYRCQVDQYKKAYLSLGGV